MAGGVAEEIMAPILLRHPQNLHDLQDHADRRCLIPCADLRYVDASSPDWPEPSTDG